MRTDENDILSKDGVDGDSENSRMYVPYLLTCAGMIAMYYIMAFLAFSNVLLKVEDGEILNAIMMDLAVLLIGVFALIFLILHKFISDPEKKKGVRSL